MDVTEALRQYLEAKKNKEQADKEYDAACDRLVEVLEKAGVIISHLMLPIRRRLPNFGIIGRGSKHSH